MREREREREREGEREREKRESERSRDVAVYVVTKIEISSRCVRLQGSFSRKFLPLLTLSPPTERFSRPARSLRYWEDSGGVVLCRMFGAPGSNFERRRG